MRPLAKGCAGAILSLAFCLQPPSAQVKTFCSEPVTPFCVNRSALFEDDLAKQRCEQEVSDYRASMAEYIECLSVQAEEADQRSSQIARRFDCMAAAGEDCP